MIIFIYNPIMYAYHSVNNCSRRLLENKSVSVFSYYPVINIVSIRYHSRWSENLLTHCDLVTSYEDIDLDLPNGTEPKLVFISH